jgi:salicylate hydroxylase
MVSCSVLPGTDVPPATEWTVDTPRLMQESMLAAIDAWHPAALALVAALDLDSIFAIPFGYIEPAESWEPSRVTVIGDAAHGMLPTLGMGANLALNDAALLTEQLEQVAHGNVALLEAIGTYEAQMRESSYPILRMTLDHDKNFGGGALAEATAGLDPA